MIKGTTESGFAFEVDEEVKDDMELLEAIIAIDKGDLNYLPEVIDRLLGSDEKARLYDHCRSEKGRVSAKTVFDEIKSIFEGIGEEDPEIKN